MTVPTPANPVLIVGDRGAGPERWHRGALAVARGGEIVAAVGRIEDGAYLRSAAKFFQALPAVLAGVEERHALGDRELALMCASHGGEDEHLAVARGMLARGGLGEDDLACGPHPPMNARCAALMLARDEAPRRIHNNCSGKHAGMMLGALARGETPSGYERPDHPVQRRIFEVVARLSGGTPSGTVFGIDGCGVPTFRLTLADAARAFGRFAARDAGLPPDWRAGADRLLSAVAAAPEMIGGAGRFCSAVARLSGGRAIVKVGADGYYGGMIPAAGIGFALHVDDGDRGASERVCAEILRRFGGLEGVPPEALDPWLDPRRLNCAGAAIGAWTLAEW
ncbi:MAG: asparaginase [Planctomycetota bacterium]